jgi:hypothetical protein
MRRTKMNSRLKTIERRALLLLFALVPMACSDNGEKADAANPTGGNPATLDGGQSDAGNTPATLPDAGGPNPGTGGAAGPNLGTGGTAGPNSGTGGTAGPNPGTGGAPSTACAQAPVAMGAAATFVVLAGSTVTNTGLTTATGDLGVSPGTAVTGFGPGTLVGTQHAADPTSAQAEAALTTAYNDAAGRTLCPNSIAGNLGGQTLVPGLYKSNTALEISSGDLTLDAQGDANAVFIFQMASTLTVSASRKVVLTGSASAANLFWQVGTSATLGTASAFQGNILADQSIAFTTGATLTGRALARIGAVTMDTNVITRP